MERLEHLKLPVFRSGLNRYKRPAPIKIKNLNNRSRSDFGRNAISKSQDISNSFNDLKQKFHNTPIDPSLIFEIEINQGVGTKSFEDALAKMDLEVLSIENKKKYWVVFSNDEELKSFQTKIKDHSDGTHKYDFFNAIENFGEIPIEKKIGTVLNDTPLTDNAEFVDIELWKMINPSKTKDFITQLESTYTNRASFKITDKLISKSLVLLRVKLTKTVFDEIIQLKEIARVERPSLPKFSPFEYTNIDVSEIEVNSPDENAAGILVIDSGVISNHPMLETCIGDEQNYQDGEKEIQDTVGHGTAVAGCAAYNNIANCIEEKLFSPSNWIFSAKVMYGEKDINGNITKAKYDPEKLVEHQLKSAVENFLDSYATIKVVNISLGNSDEVWHKNYNRQLPLAAIIDELAYDYPNVVFIVSTGNGGYNYDSIEDIKDNYPEYLYLAENRLINPATSALALTVGSIAPPIKREEPRYGNESIVVPIAEGNQPSPFTRTGCGINGMIKPELVEYGGNILLKKEYGRVKEDNGSKIPLLNNSTTDNLVKMDYGTSFSAPKVANLAGRLANAYPDASADFIKNLMLIGASYPYVPVKEFYNFTGTYSKDKVFKKHLLSCGYGLSSFEKAVSSYENRVVLWDENSIKLDDIIAYSFKLPNNLFETSGKTRVIATLTFTPETRSSRDSYLGNIMEYHIFHTVDTQTAVDYYAAASNRDNIPENLKQYEIKDFLPGTNIRKTGCHQKAIKEFSKKPNTLKEGDLTIIITNKNKWITNEAFRQNFCFSIIVEHDAEIDIYNEIRNNIQVRTRIR
jgi:hypothetical protein